MNRNDFKVKYKDASEEIDMERLKILIRRNVNSKGGEHRLLIIAMEELSELIQQLSKVLRKRTDRQCLIEEMADTLLMLESVKKICNVKTAEINKALNVKMDRLERILNERGKYE